MQVNILINDEYYLREFSLSLGFVFTSKMEHAAKLDAKTADALIPLLTNSLRTTNNIETVSVKDGTEVTQYFIQIVYHDKIVTIAQ